METLIQDVDLLRPHPPSLHKYTSPDLLKSNKRLSFYSLELENIHKNCDMVKILPTHQAQYKINTDYFELTHAKLHLRSPRVKIWSWK